MDPALMQGVSNLTRALIGSAADDASLARARASDALAGKYDAETEGLGIKNQNATNLQSAVANASTADGPLAQSILASMGGQMDNGNMIQAVPQGGPQMSVPMNANQVNVSQADQLSGLAGLARAFFGDMTYSPDQFAGGLENLQDSKARSLATTLAQGSDDQRRQAMTMMGKSPGQYFDSGVAQSELANTLTAAMDKNAKSLAGTQYTSDNTLKGTDNKTAAQFGVGGQGDRDNKRDNATTKAVAGDLTAAKERWNNYKSDREQEAANYKVNTQAGVDRDKNKAADATVRYKHDNRTVEFTVEPGKLLVIDPVSAKKAKIPIQTEGEYEGLYILDGGEKPGDVTVTVGKGDVYMNKTTADALGIKPNAKGQHVIPGAGFNDSTSSGNNASLKVSTTEAKKYQEIAVQSLDNSIGDDYQDFTNGQGIIDHVVNSVLSGVGSDNNSLVSQQIRKAVNSSEFVPFKIPGDEFYNFDKGKFLAPKGLVNKIAKSKKKNGGQLSPQMAKELTASVIAKYQYLNPEMMAILISEVPPAKEDN
jgi:hypothetical protein